MNIKKSLPFIFLLIITVIISMTTTAVGKFEEDSEMIDSTEFQINYESFNNVLQSFSNVNGSVDYTSIRNNPYNLDKFIAFINIVSPINHPELFLVADEKAYQIVFNKYDWALND